MQHFSSRSAVKSGRAVGTWELKNHRNHLENLWDITIYACCTAVNSGFCSKVVIWVNLTCPRPYIVQGRVGLEGGGPRSIYIECCGTPRFDDTEWARSLLLSLTTKKRPPRQLTFRPKILGASLDSVHLLWGRDHVGDTECMDSKIQRYTDFSGFLPGSVRLRLVKLRSLQKAL